MPPPCEHKWCTTGKGVQVSPPLPVVLRRWVGDRRSPSMSRLHYKYTSAKSPTIHNIYIYMYRWECMCVCGCGLTWSLLPHCYIVQTLSTCGIQVSPCSCTDHACIDGADISGAERYRNRPQRHRQPRSIECGS